MINEATNKKLVFIDAETEGLYGRFLSVAMIVLDSECREISRCYYGLKKELLGTVEDVWTSQHVLPVMGEYTSCSSEQEIFDKTWQYWMQYEGNAYMVADIAFPVEYRLMSQCVQKDVGVRAFCAPFPLLDLSSLLYAKGIDPLKSRYELLEMEPSPWEHNPVHDIEITIAVWKKYIIR